MQYKTHTFKNIDKRDETQTPYYRMCLQELIPVENKTPKYKDIAKARLIEASSPKELFSRFKNLDLTNIQTQSLKRRLKRKLDFDSTFFFGIDNQHLFFLYQKFTAIYNVISGEFYYAAVDHKKFKRANSSFSKADSSSKDTFIASERQSVYDVLQLEKVKTKSEIISELDEAYKEIARLKQLISTTTDTETIAITTQPDDVKPKRTTVSSRLDICYDIEPEKQLAIAEADREVINLDVLRCFIKEDYFNIKYLHYVEVAAILGLTDRFNELETQHSFINGMKKIHSTYQRMQVSIYD